MPRPTGHASVNFSQSRTSLSPPAQRALMDSLEIDERAANVPLELSTTTYKQILKWSPSCSFIGFLTFHKKLPYYRVFWKNNYKCHVTLVATKQPNMVTRRDHWSDL